MPTTYTECTQDVIDIADAVMQKHHADLLQADVRIKWLFHIHSDGAALKNKGYPVPAKSKIHGLADRVAGTPDVTVFVDHAWWTNHDTDQCRAVIDGILAELMLGEDDDGNTLTDDAGRPIVKRKPADYFIAGFDDVALRHGVACPNVRAVAVLTGKWIQAGLDFSGNDMRAEPVGAGK